MTMASAICLPEPTPPAARTGVGATASITSGHNTMEPDIAGVAPAFAALADDDVTPAAWWLRACFTDPAKAAISIPWGVNLVR